MKLPRSVSDAIYGKIPGAELANVSSIGLVWTLPCDAEVNLTFKFAGKSFPINPLDTSLDTSLDGINVTDSEGNAACVGAVRISFSASIPFELM